MHLSTLFIDSVEFNEWHLKEEWIIFLCKNASIRKQIWTIHMVYMNPRLFFFHFHAGQLERNYCSLPRLISLSAVKVQDHWEISNYVVQMTCKCPRFSFSQFCIIIPIWKYLRTSKHLHITRFCKFTECSQKSCRNCFFSMNSGCSFEQLTGKHNLMWSGAGSLPITFSQ